MNKIKYLLNVSWFIYYVSVNNIGDNNYNKKFIVRFNILFSLDFS